MKAREARWLVTTIVAMVAVVAAAIVAFVVTMNRRAPGVPSHLVPPSWAEYRESEGHREHIGRDDVACKDCHAYETAGFKSPGNAPCAKCHEKETAHAHGGERDAGSDAMAAVAAIVDGDGAVGGGDGDGGGGAVGDGGAPMSKGECLSCHAFAPNKALPTCMDCHAKSQSHFAAIGQHSSTACTSCHKPHGDPGIVAKDCGSSGCHDGVKAEEHAKHKGSKGCTDCHVGHAPAAAARSACASCHTKPAGPKPAGHDSCMSCHKPHDFVAGGAKACVGCHSTKPTLLASTIVTHAVCTNCHVPHNPGAAASSCANCHADVHVGHAGRTACVGCHAPHGGDPSVKAAACTTCHRAVASNDHAAHAKGLACEQCHAKHELAIPQKPALCAGCHSKEVTLVATNKGHADCASCHGASTHTPTKGAACATCHAAEASTAKSGHAKCGSCHETHSGARSPQAACASCHADRAKGPHANVQGSCQSCHRAHGPKGVASPPPCASCHTRGSLPALHVSQSHATCSNCHTSHAPPQATRATCTNGTCHSNKADHQPQAQVCNGCHRFRK